MTSLVRYSASYAFLGLYICRPELRVQGYGMRAWQAAMELAGTRTIGLDGVPETNPDAVRLAEARGLTPVFETARMYRGAPPPIAIEKVYGITTFEVG